MSHFLSTGLWTRLTLQLHKKQGQVQPKHYHGFVIDVSVLKIHAFEFLKISLYNAGETTVPQVPPRQQCDVLMSAEITQSWLSQIVLIVWTLNKVDQDLRG